VNEANVAALALVGAVLAATVAIGGFGRRLGRTTSDLLVASRTVHPALNATAICGEYLSAGTFLGLAGLVLVYGVDMLWYPVGFTMGYVVLLLFVAAPLRRFGAYTIPDFAAARLDAPQLRRIASCFVLVVCGLYLLPQMKAAGVVLGAIAGVPYWVGVVLVGVIVTANVALGGMRSITYVQAFHYVVKATAISFPLILMAIVWWGRGADHTAPGTALRFQEATTIEVMVDTTIRIDEAIVIAVDGTPRPFVPGLYDIGARTTLGFERDALVPHAEGLPALSGDEWARPLASPGTGTDHPLYFVYSLILATFLGTMGLPHIIVRFYTNPDGRAARRTTLIVLVLLGVYYVFPPLYGVLGRRYAPDLVLTGRIDEIVLVLPGRILDGALATGVTAVLAAGAFAALMSTASGLLVSMSGTISHDLVGGRVAAFRLASVAGGTAATLLGLWVERFGINIVVGWAFAIAASAFCPLVILGVWWRRLTGPGAIAGMVAGGALSACAIAVTMAMPDLRGWPAAVLSQPAAWSVPAAFVATIAMSLRTRHAVPRGTAAMFVSMHAPEALGVGRPLRP
jgi:cation/acetate symporter